MKPRPCPFCAHASIRFKALRTRASFAGHGNIYAYTCECEACGATGPNAQDENQAVERWNCRNVQVDLFNEPTPVPRPKPRAP